MKSILYKIDNAVGPFMLPATLLVFSLFVGHLLSLPWWGGIIVFIFSLLSVVIFLGLILYTAGKTIAAMRQAELEPPSWHSVERHVRTEDSDGMGEITQSEC